MSTVQKIVDFGFAKSAAARPETMTATGELVQRVGLCLREVFQAVSKEVPYMVGDIATIGFDGFGWPRPVNCLRALHLAADAGTIANPALAVGAEINNVPFTDKLFCRGLPSVYEFGQKFWPVGQAMDPSGGTLTLMFARAPIMPTAMADSIDPLFPDFMDDLLECDIAAYVALKDERDSDKDSFLSLKALAVAQLLDWAKQQSYNLKQRFPITSPPLSSASRGNAQPASGQ